MHSQSVSFLQKLALLPALHHLSQSCIAADCLCHIALLLICVFPGFGILSLLSHFLHQFT